MAEFEARLSPEQARAFSALKRTYTDDSPLDVLGKLPADQILNSTELKIFEQEIARPLPDQEAPAKDLVLILKATKLCNLRCEYCVSWGEGPNQIMPFRTLVRTLREFLQLRNVRASTSYGMAAK